MYSKKVIYLLLLSTVIILLAAAMGSATAVDDLSKEEQLGKSIYFDENLSIKQNQSCASCHGPEAGFTGDLSDTNAHGAVYEGSIPTRFGNRKPPSAAYATQSPVLFKDGETWTGGNFWDGRATGEVLGNPAADQAQGPFLNPAEQALFDSACVVYRVCNPVVPADYPVLAEDVWPGGSCAITWPPDVDTVCAAEAGTVTLSAADRIKSDKNYDRIGLTIAAYEASDEVNPFSSKYDLSLGGQVKLTDQEKRGLRLFRKEGKCSLCHPDSGRGALFTDYTFDNLGVPKNPENPVYDGDPTFVDVGLGGFRKTEGDDAAEYMAEWGKQKVPTLRNVDKRPDETFVKAFTHNGYFKTLEGIVHFYNTRDIKPECPTDDHDFTEAEALAYDGGEGCWPPPEVVENVNKEELGDLGLTPEEEADLVAFMKTLSDGYEESYLYLPIIVK